MKKSLFSYLLVMLIAISLFGCSENITCDEGYKLSNGTCSLIEIEPTSITINDSNFTLSVGETRNLSVSISPNNTNTSDSISWTSSNSTVASVGSTGLVRALGVGVATITARTTNGKTSSVTVTVEALDAHHITDRKVVYYEDEELYRFFIGFEDVNDNRMSTSGSIYIEILDGNGNIIYSETHLFDESDFDNWGNQTTGYTLKLAIELNIDDFASSETTDGVLKYRIDLDSGVYWDTLSIDISDLPLNINVSLPDLPLEVKRYFSTGTLWYKVNLTEIDWSYETNYDGTIDIILSFTGTKTYYYKGNNVSSSNTFSIRILDSDGYVVDTKTVYPPSLMVGESFRDEEVKFYNLDVGEYTIEIIVNQQ